jgi:hypothetical protein
VLVVEANQVSGALVTARLARRMDRLVLAVPGSPGPIVGAGEARPVADEAALLGALAAGGGPHRAPLPRRRAAAPVARVSEVGPAGSPRRLGRSLPTRSPCIAEGDGWVRRGPAGRFSSLQEIKEVSRGS